MNKRKICVVITARPSYSRFKSALQAIKAHPELELQIVVAASALLPRYGSIIDCLEKELQLLSSKLRFINYVIDDKIKVYKQSKQMIIDSLKDFQFPFYENNCVKDFTDKDIKTEYNYLLNLSVYSFTLEKVQELEDEIDTYKQELECIKNTTEKEIWIKELDEFEAMYKRNY